jgi:hypothetical protein
MLSQNLDNIKGDFNMKTIQNIRNIIENTKSRSAWDRGVNAYALELLEEYEQNYGANACAPSEADLLNGAPNWKEYSWGGCSLIYDGDIAERLCSPSELKKTRNGEKKPNSREEWLDTQARALFQAAQRIKYIAID